MNGYRGNQMHIVKMLKSCNYYLLASGQRNQCVGTGSLPVAKLRMALFFETRCQSVLVMEEREREGKGEEKRGSWSGREVKSEEGRKGEWKVLHLGR